MSYMNQPPFTGALERFPTIPVATRSLQAASLSQLIVVLQDPDYREQALHELAKDRGEDLAPLLWNSCGTMAILLQELLPVYRILVSPNLKEKESRRICNALVLLQRVASHPDTRKQFLKAEMPLYLYPFMGTMLKDRAHEWLRANCLSVIGALVKDDDAEVVHYLIASQIFPYCLNCMDVGSELSKSLATAIVLKILKQDEGLKYSCTVAERFFAVTTALANVVEKLPETFTENTPRLLKNVIQIYLRLSEDPRACDALALSLPTRLRDKTLIYYIHDDPRTMGFLQQLFYNVRKGSCTGSGMSQPLEEALGGLIVGQSQ